MIVVDTSSRRGHIPWAGAEVSNVIEYLRETAKPIHQDEISKFRPQSIATVFWERQKLSEIRVVKRENLAGSLVLELIDRELLAPCQLFPSRRYPLRSELIMGMALMHPRKTAVILGGSHLYGLATTTSDYDAYVVTDGVDPDHREGDQATRLGPYLRYFTLEGLREWAGKGHRWALEILAAPEECWIQGEYDMQVKIHQIGQQCKAAPESILQASRVYRREWMPMLAAHRGDVPDPKIRCDRFSHDNGWSPRLAYFLLIDAMLSWQASKTGKFNVRYPSVNGVARELVMACKNGTMTPERWLKTMAAYGTAEAELESVKERYHV